MKYKKIIGGTEKEAEEKFPWLKNAVFENAEIDITKDFLVWKNGIWKNGVWESGTWKDGTWRRGIWKMGYGKTGFGKKELCGNEISR